MGFVMVTTWRENVAAGHIERKMAVTLTKEQASMLLPLLPNLAGLIASQTSSKAATTNGGEYTQSEALYSISDMFSKKKKNSCSTAAQNYLLVSNCSYVLASSQLAIELIIQSYLQMFA